MIKIFLNNRKNVIQIQDDVIGEDTLETVSAGGRSSVSGFLG